MNLTLISAAISAAIGFGAAWQLQSLRMDSHEKDRIEAARAAERELSRLEQARSLQVLTAQNDARKRESKLRLDAAAANDELGKLRDTISHLPTAGDATCPDTDRTLAIGELLAQCGQELTTLAGKCDRHVSDIQTLIDSWK